MPSASTLTIRSAEASDIPLLIRLTRELAEVEKFPYPVTVSDDALRESLFGQRPAAEAVLGFVGAEPVGFAVFYQTFATTTGRPGLHLDDLFVRPAFQGRGYGKALLGHVAAVARGRGCARFEWWALRWNEQALGFYQAIGARRLEEIVVHRAEGETLDRLAGVDA
jgi:GNAT superfamily N-acetyltransferase